MSRSARIVGIGETPYVRGDGGRETGALLSEAALLALDDAGLGLRDVDGLAVASLTLAPDHAIDLAFRLGLRLRWLMDDACGGASGLNMLSHARRALEAGDADAILILAGDAFEPANDFRRLAEGYNTATRDHLAPLSAGGPNPLFALLTQRHMARHGLTREHYWQLVAVQRAAAGLEPLSLEAYLAAPPVADPLTRYDCVPIVSGADALLVRSRGDGPGIRAHVSSFNEDGQEGDGLRTGIGPLADWAGLAPEDVDVAEIYDDYPVMVLVQLEELGFGAPADLVQAIAAGRLHVNTSGGQLCAGQAGLAGGLHLVVEAVRRLRAGAHRALVTGYGAVAYRHGACANATVLE